MFSPSFREMVKGRLREFWREPSASFFVILVPLMWMLIFGVAFSGGDKVNYGIGLISETQSDTPSSENWHMGADWDQLRDQLAKDNRFRVYKGDRSEIDALFKRGRVIAAVKEGNRKYEIVVDPANPESNAAKILLNDVIQQMAGRQDRLLVTEELRELPGTRYIDFFIPGLLALSIMTSSLFGTGMTIVAFRRNKLFKRFSASPVNTFELILSFIVGRLFILAVEFGVIIAAGYLFFGFRISGDFLSFVSFAVLGACCFTALGILFGARLDNVGAYNGIVNLLTLPLMIVSGVFFSRSKFPEWLDGYLDYLPLSPLVDGLRRIALEGATMADLSGQLLVLTIYTVLAVIITKPLFRWY
ncbi:MAG: ABC transporter permease [Oligoflexales bacterium]|nr:ABC transporter permease [Oligoflexales bacterium]